MAGPLKEHHAERIISLAENGTVAEFESFNFARFTLGAAARLACAVATDETLETRLKESLHKPHEGGNILQALTRALRDQLRRREFSRHPKFDVRTLLDADSLKELDGAIFLEHFRSALRKNGFTNDQVILLSDALIALAKNAPRHSGPRIPKPAPAFTAFEVDDGTMTFVVADIGRGVRSSLRSVQKWRSCTSDLEALEAILQHGASAKEDSTAGNGIRTLRRAVIELDGAAWFRSGDALVSLNARQIEVKSEAVFPVNGLQLAVTIRATSR